MGVFSPIHWLIILIVGGSLFGDIALVIFLLCQSACRKNDGTRAGDANNPNLTPYPDCRKYVSRLAVNCPNCGRPLKS
jgi:hypothetical protein